ncbi:hypothetical protein Bpfe_004461 [Biomphalaria pfeifferi]|uniref:Uncharacterized protein n=1 Tax=Biomphalaria pfeifferi TaxID=112525 RepID=A0AAD8C4W2_BIOPF|nr:hypothetical protein Bpfe_004461 [Biomphalaria pfeifferi]
MNEAMKYSKPYQGNIGKDSLKYPVDKSGIKLPDYKPSINPKDVKSQPREYKQTIDSRPKRAANRPPPPQPKPKAPKPTRAANPAPRQAKFKGYEPNIKWDPKQKVNAYEPKLYKGNINQTTNPVKMYELPEDYYGFPKRKEQPPVKKVAPQSKPVEKKVKLNKVEPLPPPPQPPPAPAPPPVERKKTPPKKAPAKPIVPDPLVEAPLPPPPPPPVKVKTPPPAPAKEPVYVFYDPPSPEPYPPTRREYYPKPEPFYNSKPEPIFPPLIPISMSDYLSSEPKAKETTQKPRGNPLIPVMYPPSKLYDLSRYSPLPMASLDDDIYQIRGSGVPMYSAIGLLLRNSGSYSYY